MPLVVKSANNHIKTGVTVQRKSISESSSTNLQSSAGTQHSVVSDFVVTVQQDFEETMVERGIFQMDSSKQEVIKKYVSTNLFRELKFIGHESQMEIKGPLARKILTEFAVVPPNQKQF